MKNQYPKQIGVGDFVYRNLDFVPLITQATGCTLKDSQGQTYLDGEAANGTVGLGYRNDILKIAVEKVLDMPSLPSFLESSLRLQVANKLSHIFEEATGRKGRISFELGGAQGIELAVKIALTNTPGSLFAVLEGGYHGRSLFTSHLSASHRYRISPDGPRVLRLPYPDFNSRINLLNEDFEQHLIPYVDFTLNNDLAGYKDAKFAALIIEPILNVGGMVLPDREYIKYLVDTFRNRGALIILDEVFTGYYRTGREWGFQHFDISPDIIVTSKAFSNGLVPVSCVWAKDPYLSPDNFSPSTHSITYSNNPLNLAVVDTVLDFYKEENIKPKVIKLEQKMKDLLEKITEEFSFVKKVTVMGGIVRIQLTLPIANLIKTIASKIFSTAPHQGYNGLILASTNMTPDIICIHPPFTISESDLAILAELLRHTLKNVESNEL